jgi:Tol biopolymer transport system component
LVRLPFPRFFPDGDRLLVSGAEEDEAQRSYVVNLDGSGVRPITPEEHLGVVVSPDGRWVAAHCPGGPELHAVDDGESRSIGGIEPGDEIVQWRADGRSLFVIQRAELPARVSLVDIENGDRTLWKEIAPADRAGVAGTINTIVVNPDGSAYAYRYVRILSELYLADGLR